MTAVGTGRGGLKNAMQSTGVRLDTRSIDLDVRRDGKSLIVEAGKARGILSRPKPATLWMVVFDDAKKVKIERGENKGRTVTYTNVVRRIEPIGTWKGDAMTLKVPLPADGSAKCAVILQEGNGSAPGAILAAAKL